jgi:hypothetical protein
MKHLKEFQEHLGCDIRINLRTFFKTAVMCGKSLNDEEIEELIDVTANAVVSNASYEVILAELDELNDICENRRKELCSIK